MISNLKLLLFILVLFVFNNGQAQSLENTKLASRLIESGCKLVPAEMISTDISSSDNYILINKGSYHGIESGMGVVSEQGITGVVIEASENFAIVQSVLNRNLHFSCKTENSSSFGTLKWDTIDYRYATLENFPHYEELMIGDTIVTSGFSSIFPEGIVIGAIDSYAEGENFYSIKVKLSTDFSKRSDVLVIKYVLEEEVPNVES